MYKYVTCMTIEDSNELVFSIHFIQEYLNFIFLLNKKIYRKWQSKKLLVQKKLKILQ